MSSKTEFQARVAIEPCDDKSGMYRLTVGGVFVQHMDALSTWALLRDAVPTFVNLVEDAHKRMIARNSNLIFGKMANPSGEIRPASEVLGLGELAKPGPGKTFYVDTDEAAKGSLDRAVAQEKVYAEAEKKVLNYLRVFKKAGQYALENELKETLTSAEVYTATQRLSASRRIAKDASGDFSIVDAAPTEDEVARNLRFHEIPVVNESKPGAKKASKKPAKRKGPSKAVVLLKYTELHPKASSGQAAKDLGLSANVTATTYHDLLKRGLVKRTGESGSYRYTVAKTSKKE